MLEEYQCVQKSAHVEELFASLGPSGRERTKMLHSKENRASMPNENTQNG